MKKTVCRCAMPEFCSQCFVFALFYSFCISPVVWWWPDCILGGKNVLWWVGFVFLAPPFLHLHLHKQNLDNYTALAAVWDKLLAKQRRQKNELSRLVEQNSRRQGFAGSLAGGEGRSGSGWDAQEETTPEINKKEGAIKQTHRALSSIEHFRQCSGTCFVRFNGSYVCIRVCIGWVWLVKPDRILKHTNTDSVCVNSKS